MDATFSKVGEDLTNTRTLDFSDLTVSSTKSSYGITPEKTNHVENLNHIMLGEILHQREAADIKMLSQKDEIESLT
jgi:hypothetical protein